MVFITYTSYMMRRKIYHLRTCNEKYVKFYLYCNIDKLEKLMKHTVRTTINKQINHREQCIQQYIQSGIFVIFNKYMGYHGNPFKWKVNLQTRKEKT